jgi:hypothetical protein
MSTLGKPRFYPAGGFPPIYRPLEKQVPHREELCTMIKKALANSPGCHAAPSAASFFQQNNLPAGIPQEFTRG